MKLMKLRPLNRTKCHNPDCLALIEMPDSILREASCYLSRTAMGGDYVAVACGGCRLVSPYSGTEFHDAGMTDMLDPFRNDQLNLFYVLLECGNKNCEFLIGAFAPRPAHMTLDDLRGELDGWTVSDELRCACGLPAISLKAASLRRCETEFCDNSPEDRP